MYVQLGVVNMIDSISSIYSTSSSPSSEDDDSSKSSSSTLVTHLMTVTITKYYCLLLF